MSHELIEELPNSTNTVEPYNRLGRSTHGPLKTAMMATYKDDMAKSLEIIGSRQGLTTCYNDQCASAHSKCSTVIKSENDDPGERTSTYKAQV